MIQPPRNSSIKRSNSELDSDKEEEDEVDEEPVRKRSRRGDGLKRTGQAKKKSVSKRPQESKKTKALNSKPIKVESMSEQLGTESKVEPELIKSAPSSPPEAGEPTSHKGGSNSKATKTVQTADAIAVNEDASEIEEEDPESEEEGKPEVAAKAREKVQSALKSSGKDPYSDWRPGEPVPYAALCTTFSLVEMTTKRLIISAHCSLFLRQVLRLTPQDLLPTVQLMINKLAADYAGIELGIGESLIMKAIGETTGRSLSIIKADQNEIGDLGLVAAKSRSNQPTMFKPKALTVKGVLDGLMGIAIISGDGSQGRKIAGIKKLLSAADTAIAGKGSKGIDITKDKGGASEAKFIVRFLEGKLRLGLAEKTVLVALAHAMVIYETEKKGNKLPSSEQLAKGESMLKTVYR